METSQDILEQRVTVMKHALATPMKFVVDISTQAILTIIPTLFMGLDCKNFVEYLELDSTLSQSRLKRIVHEASKIKASVSFLIKVRASSLIVSSSLLQVSSRFDPKIE